MREKNFITIEAQQYMEPEVELISVEVERGFAGSEVIETPEWDMENGEHDFWK